MSSLETAKMNGLEPHTWLTDVLQRLPGRPEARLNELLPQPDSPSRGAIPVSNPATSALRTCAPDTGNTVEQCPTWPLRLQELTQLLRQSLPTPHSALHHLTTHSPEKLMPVLPTCQDEFTGSASYGAGFTFSQTQLSVLADRRSDRSALREWHQSPPQK